MKCKNCKEEIENRPFLPVFEDGESADYWMHADHNHRLCLTKQGATIGTYAEPEGL